MNKQTIQKIIRMHMTEVQHCYEVELIKNQTLEGKVVLRFTIGLKEEVLETSISSSTFPSPDVEKCLLSVAKKWQFPKPSGGGMVIVNYPFVFKTNGSTP
jgi:TonB family protein